MRRTIYTAALAAAFMIAAPAFAADTAPLPDGFESAGASTVPGLYAHGVDFESRLALEQSMIAAEKSCQARGRTLDYAGDRRRWTDTEYWLYRSGDVTVVFESRGTVDVDVDHCKVTFAEKRKVSRGTDEAGAWPSPFRGGHGCSRVAKNCYTETKFGIKARCSAEGNGFQGSRHCVSVDRGVSRGLLLESVYESDDMSGSGFIVTDLKCDASLDASLFDRSHAW